MPTRIKLPDGSIGVFPDEMSDDQITAVIHKEFPPGARLGGSEAAIGPAAPETIWQRLTRAKSEFLDSEDPSGRAEARAAGIGLQPTPREMAQAALAGLGAGTFGAALGMVGAPSAATLSGAASTAVDVAPKVIEGDVSGAAKDIVVDSLIDRVLPGTRFLHPRAKNYLARALAKLAF